MQIGLKAAFGGLTWLPWWIALGSSNLSPLLDLQDEKIVYRIVQTKEAAYGEIASVDFRKAIGTRNIQLSFADSSWTFSGNVVDDDQARAALRILRDKGCTLTKRAAAFLDAD
jgi:hypothetical protein